MKDELLREAEAAILDILRYSNCDHPVIDDCCVYCEGKRVAAQIHHTLRTPPTVRAA